MAWVTGPVRTGVFNAIPREGKAPNQAKTNPYFGTQGTCNWDETLLDMTGST